MDGDYRVKLDAYHGPLDLLLLLVRRHEVDLHDIPIAELTDQYLHHLQLIQQIDVNLAGEFLVMAATLLEIKSAMLVPHPAGDAESGEPGEQLDPRFELVQQLLTYKKFKDAALQLDERRLEWQARFPRTPGRSFSDADEAEGDGAILVESESEVLEIDLEDVHVLDLCESFSRILDTIGRRDPTHEVVYDDTPIGLHVEDILDRLTRDGTMTLQAIFVGRQTRGEMIGLFLAMLELIRQRKVRALQARLGGDITLELITDVPEQREDEAEPDWRDPQTGEIQYDWPSAEAQQRAETRSKRRAERLKNKQFGQDDSDDDLIIVDTDE